MIPRGERATRDIVSRAMLQEMRAGRTTPEGGLYISMGHLGPDKVRRQFKGMVERCADCGFDLAGGLVEVVPTAHYLMGGVVCAVDTTDRAAGPVRGRRGCRRHARRQPPRRQRGGQLDRLRRHCRRCNARVDQDTTPVIARPTRMPSTAAIAAARHPLTRKPGDLNRLRDTLLDLMWEDVGIIRSADSLARGLKRLDDIGAELHTTGLADTDLAFNLTWHDWLNLENLIAMSKVIASAALRRENSRGAHFRTDFPVRAICPHRRLRWYASRMASCRWPRSRFSSRS